MDNPKTQAALKRLIPLTEGDELIGYVTGHSNGDHMAVEDYETIRQCLMAAEKPAIDLAELRGALGIGGMWASIRKDITDRQLAVLFTAASAYAVLLAINEVNKGEEK